MGAPKVIYRDSLTPRTNSWDRYIVARIKRNENFICAITGGPGIGKTYTGLSEAVALSKDLRVPFSLNNVVFDFLALMRLINSGNLKKGSPIVIEEPQVQINAKKWQSEINQVFYQLASTFRHKGYIVLFCNPFLTDLDKSVRKLFHAEWHVEGKDENLRLAKVRPLYLEWNSQLDDFYHHFLRVVYKPEGKSRYISRKLKQILIPHPPQELADAYEQKKITYTTALNLRIQARLEELERKELAKPQIVDKHPLKCLKCGYEWQCSSKNRIVACPSCLCRVRNNTYMPAYN